jgi:DNA polymerase-4
MVQVDYDTYSAISKQVHEIMHNYSDEVERYSMDEFFLNLSFLQHQPEPHIRQHMQRMQDEIQQQTGLVGTVGVSYSKTYAKLSSSLHKPRGISIVLNPEMARQRIYPLPVGKVWGIGRRRRLRIQQQGLESIGDVVDRCSEQTFARLFGPHFGPMLYTNIVGRDQGRILTENDHYTPKGGVSYGHTFSEGSRDADQIRGEFALAVQQIGYRMRSYGLKSMYFGGMIGFNKPDQPSVGFSFETPTATNIDDLLYTACLQQVQPLIRAALRAGREIRNLGLWCSKPQISNQLNLFFQEEGHHLRKYQAVDTIRNRFGHRFITLASAMNRVPGQTHFLERS